MTADDFWDQLEYRVCREIAGLRAEELRGLWCDGFLPEPLEMVDDQPFINGRVWMGRGPRQQEEWSFSLSLPQGLHAEAEIDWEAILPAEDVTGWLSLDPVQRIMRIVPMSVYLYERKAAE